MEHLESQIAKIQLGNNKTSLSFVYIMAEKASGSDAELYMIAELPMLSPAAQEPCERICQGIAGALKRSYRNRLTENSFENAISQINEELAKLASLGQTQWIDKLNCVLGVKDEDNFHITTCGKVAAYLMRSQEFTDISCSPSQSHPLKTFENYASGKIRLGDLLILSTTQLFNYVSMDRLLDIFSGQSFLPASQTVLELLKETSDPQVSFGVLLNLQVPAGETPEEELDLEDYTTVATANGPSLLGKVLDWGKNAVAVTKTAASRSPKTDLPRVKQSFANVPAVTKNLLSKSKNFWQRAKSSAESMKSQANVKNLQNFSPQKKFLFASVLILLIAAVVNIAVAFHVSKTRKTNAQVTAQLKTIQGLLSNAQSSLLYKDSTSAGQYFNQAKAELPAAKNIPSAEKDLYNQILSQLNDTENLMEKNVTAQVTNLGSLGNADNLIKLPTFVAIQSNNSIISYNKQTGKVDDGSLSDGGANIVGSIYISGNVAAIYDGNSLYQWDFSKSKLGPAFSSGVPNKNNFAGIAQYPTNTRVYMVDKSAAAVISFLPGPKNTFTKPVVALRDQSFSNAEDLTIDGNLYILTNTGIQKYQAGQAAQFSMPPLPKPYSGKGKIYTQKDFNNLYLLDIGNNRILVMDKRGNLMETLISNQFTQLKDFQVDEKNRVIYVLNDGSLLKVALP